MSIETETFKLRQRIDLFNQPDFDGSDYDSSLDKDRLTGQIKRIFDFMQGGKWQTLSEIAAFTKDSEASISAQLRNMRKDKFGAHTINKQRRGDRSNGLFEYQLIINQSTNGHTP